MKLLGRLKERYSEKQQVNCLFSGLTCQFKEHLELQDNESVLSFMERCQKLESRKGWIKGPTEVKTTDPAVVKRSEPPPVKKKKFTPRRTSVTKLRTTTPVNERTCMDTLQTQPGSDLEE